MLDRKISFCQLYRHENKHCLFLICIVKLILLHLIKDHIFHMFNVYFAKMSFWIHTDQVVTVFLHLQSLLLISLQ